MKKLSLDELAIIAFDFDGVFTDNKVICDSEGLNMSFAPVPQLWHFTSPQ